MAGRPPAPALLDALRLVFDGFPVYASARAVGIQPSRVFVQLARFEGSHAERAFAALQRLEPRVGA